MKKKSLNNTGLILLGALFVLFANTVSAQEKSDSSKMHHHEQMMKDMKDMPDSCRIMMKDMPDSCKMMMKGMKDMPDSCKMMMKGMKDMPDSCKMMKEHEQGKKGHMKGHKMMGDKKMKKHDKMNHEKMKHMKIDIDMKGMDSHKSIIREGEIDLSQIDKNKDGKVFQDQMDWNVISDAPGKCPVCEMKLKEVTIDDAKKNLIENGFKLKE